MVDFPIVMPVDELAVDRHDGGSEALRFAWLDGDVESLTFAQVSARSRALATRLSSAGIAAGTPVALVLPQSPLTAIAHVALSRLGAVSVPLSPLFGPDGLAPRVDAVRPALVITHESRLAAVHAAAPRLPTWVARGRELDADARALERGPLLRAPGVAGERPLSVIFTSGTTAQPKGAVLPQRIVAGRMPGVMRAHPGLGPGAVFWSPADGAWIGGLYDSLFAPWAAGATVFAYERAGHFDPARADALLRANGVTNVFVPPTALRLWMRSGAAGPPLRSLQTAGEPLPPPVHAWATQAFGIAPREVYGLTECAYLVVNDEADAAFTGRAVSPPHRVEVRNERGPAAPGEEGELCVRRGSPTMMLGYIEGDTVRLPVDALGWFGTGDLAVADREGRITVRGRLDDVVKVRGYRVAPREVEACLLRHPSVEDCAVAGVADAERGTALHAFVKTVVPASGHDDLVRELQDFVRTRLAAHEVPSAVRFVDDLPRTTTGKVRRRDLRGA